VHGNLSTLSAIVWEVRQVAEGQGLKASETAYRRWGKGPRPPLRFSKSGEARVERAYATHWVSRREGSPRPADATGEESAADLRMGHEEAEETAVSPEPRQNILQPGVRIERDPVRVRELAEEKRDENVSPRVFLKWGPLSPRLVDRLFHRLFVEVAAEIDCTECAACCMKRCSCYGDRPADCRSYPHLQKKNMTTRMSAVLDNASLCPIVFGVLERLKAELGERGIDWRVDPVGGFFRQP
jgi:hypothetical protein